MTKGNARIFLGIFVATMLAVAYVWHITAPEPVSKPSHTKTASTAAPTKPMPPVKPPALPSPKLPTFPKPPKEPTITPVTIDMGIPALVPQKKITVLTMPDIAPSTRSKHVDPRIAVAALTSGDEFDLLVNKTLSFVEYVFTH
jgi:hypothetical protein